MKAAFLAVVLILAPAVAEAACNVANLAGTWDAYLFVAVIEGSGSERCVLKINATGRLISGSSCDSGSKLSGQFKVNSNCRVAITMTEKLGSATARCAIRGTLAKSKEDLAGTGQCNTPSSFLVNAIKR